MMIVRMNKVDHYTFGEAYFLTMTNIEVYDGKEVKITISEYEAEKLKPLFSHSTKSGKFNENEEWS